MSAHLEAIAALRAAQGCTDRPSVLTASAGDDELSVLVCCVTCTGNRGGWCIRGRVAGLGVASLELGTMAEMPQHCRAYVARPQLGVSR